MPPSSADPDTIAAIRRLALDEDRVWTSKQARSDMLAHNLRLAEVCDAIVDWVDAGERVKPTTLHSFADRVGQAAYEMKPKLNGTIFYIKVTIDDRGLSCEALGVLSVHPPH